MKIYAIEHITENIIMGVFNRETKLSTKAFTNLEDAIKEIEWRSNGSATQVKDNSLKWHWVDNGDHYYLIHELIAE